MANVILQPASGIEPREHYQLTVVNPVSLSRIRDHLASDAYEALATAVGTDSTCVWGMRPSMANRWQQIQVGDKVIFAKENRFFSLSTVTWKTNSHSLAIDLWGFHDSGDTWEFIYFFGPPDDIDIPYPDINAVTGYSPKYVPQGVNVLSSAKAQAVIELLNIGDHNEFELTQCWVFQANPDRFDVDTYIERQEDILWSVNQSHFRDQMNTGDKVYIWRAQGRRFQNKVYGVIAEGTISGKPEVLQDDAPDLWRGDDAAQEPIQLRVPVSITRRCVKDNQVIQSQWLAQDPITSGLAILRMRSLTNYLIEASESERISYMVSNAPTTPISEREIFVQASAAITGTKAEQYLMSWFPTEHPEWGEPIDRTTSVGLGFDVEFTRTNIKVEAKGCRGDIENLRITEHEWNIAKQLGDSYCLAIVSRLDAEIPKVDLIFDPYRKLQDHVVEEKRLQVNYMIRRNSITQYTS